jgi:hypothetical protein
VKCFLCRSVSEYRGTGLGDNKGFCGNKWVFDDRSLSSLWSSAKLSKLSLSTSCKCFAGKNYLYLLEVILVAVTTSRASGYLMGGWPVFVNWRE